MTRRSISHAILVGLGLASLAGCSSDTTPAPAPTTSGKADYGDYKMPPADQVKAKPGRGAGSPGAPPVRR